MNRAMVKKLIKIAERHSTQTDSSHDMIHLKRVLANAIRIAKAEGGDLDIVAPAAIFHDLITYRKDDKRSDNEQKESAVLAAKLLAGLGFTKNQIRDISYAIEVCAFRKNLIPTTLEAKIIQDADMLESTGAISIMRTFASAGAMHKRFYRLADPFCTKRNPDPHEYALDLFYSRLLVVQGRMHTKTAKDIARQRTRFLKEFLKQFKSEVDDTKDIMRNGM